MKMNAEVTGQGYRPKAGDLIELLNEVPASAEVQIEHHTDQREGDFHKIKFQWEV